MKKKHELLLFIIAIFITIATYYFQYIPSSQGEINGVCADNIKGRCHPVAGFPIPYVRDSEAVSVIGTLSFPDDEIAPQWFLLDVMIHYALLILIFKLLIRLKVGSQKRVVQ